MTTAHQAPIYQLRIDLKGIRPPIWRRVLVPSDVSLEDLHEIIQAVMPWWDAHLHQFSDGWNQYGIPDNEGWFDVMDSRTVAINEVLPTAGDKIEYEYDFGDSWVHQIRLEKILDPDPDVIYPICIKGKRACPPEDCGGIYGYMRMLEALQNPKDPEYEMYQEWIGDDFEPEAFDLEDANLALQEISLEGASIPPPEMQPLNRMAVALKPRETVYEWVRTLPEYHELTFQEVRQASVIVLIPLPETEDEFETFLFDALPTWMAMMFSIWDKNPDTWPVIPEDVDFEEWFDVEIYARVIDVGLMEDFDRIMNSGLGEVLNSMLGSMDEDDLEKLMGLN
jgi:hypothetical protein